MIGPCGTATRTITATIVASATPRDGSLTIQRDGRSWTVADPPEGHSETQPRTR
jgi:hypothetical protein